MIALARGEAVELPDTAAIWIITLCGLHTASSSPTTVSARADSPRSPWPSVADARRARRRPGMADSLIAATAAANGLPVYTRNKDFLGLSGIEAALT